MLLSPPILRVRSDVRTPSLIRSTQGDLIYTLAFFRRPDDLASFNVVALSIRRFWDSDGSFFAQSAFRRREGGSEAGKQFRPALSRRQQKEGPDKVPPVAGGFLHSIAKVFLVERLFLLLRILDGKLFSRIT